MQINTNVRLKSFLGTKINFDGTKPSENYWILIGQIGKIIDKDKNDNKRVLVLFDINIDDYNLENHNPVKNSLWINKSDLEIIIPDKLSKNDIQYSNQYFWYFYISCFRGSDDEKELNLDDAINEVIDIKKHLPDFNNWYYEFLPENEADDEGLFENPKFISEKLTKEMSFSIELHLSEITFYLNNYYIGNLGGHFECWFLTFKELLAFDKYDFLFLLLLPMVGIEKRERTQAEAIISKKLKSIMLFAKQSDYITQCIANDLIVDDGFYEKPDIGIACSQNHSVRNIIKYPRYREEVIKLNKALKTFTEKT